MPADQHPMRFGFLDGLRGWAAVIVLFHHVFVDGLPANDFMADRLFWARIFFMNGTFAVCLFFVISGFSLSISYLQTGDERGLARMAAGRYVRLAIPIFAICSITYLLLALNIIPPFRGKAAPAGYLWHVHAKCCGTVRIFAGWGVCVSVQRRKLRSAAVDHVL
jgi:peptidoglycan/LPS O-acetylase OafA/YrhL